MANSPLFAALQKQIEEIIVVLLSPVGHRSAAADNLAMKDWNSL
jgi:hypothetical protein